MRELLDGSSEARSKKAREVTSMRETKQVKEEMIVGIGEFYAWSEIDM